MGDITSQENDGNLKGNLYVKNYLETDIKGIYNAYYYKSYEVFEKILNDGFKVTNIKFFNDPKEGLIPYRKIIDFGNNEDKKNIRCHRIIKKQIDENYNGECKKDDSKKIKKEVEKFFDYIDSKYLIVKTNYKIDNFRKEFINLLKCNGEECIKKIVQKIIEAIINQLSDEDKYIISKKEFCDDNCEKFYINEYLKFEEYPISWDEFFFNEENKSESNLDKDFKNHIEKIFQELNDEKDEFGKRFYAIPMTREKESIPMWMNYAKKVKGLSIEFDLEELVSEFNSENSKYKPYLIGKVYYGKEAKEKIVEITRKYKEILYNKNKNELQIEEKEEKAYKDALQAVQLLRKRKDWSYEEEVRIIFKAYNEDGSRNTEEGSVIKYIENPISNLKKTISKVIVSPYNSNYVKLKKDLESKGIKNVEKSKLSIRKV